MGVHSCWPFLDVLNRTTSRTGHHRQDRRTDDRQPGEHTTNARHTANTCTGVRRAQYFLRHTGRFRVSTAATHDRSAARVRTPLSSSKASSKTASSNEMAPVGPQIAIRAVIHLFPPLGQQRHRASAACTLKSLPVAQTTHDSTFSVERTKVRRALLSANFSAGGRRTSAQWGVDRVQESDTRR